MSSGRLTGGNGHGSVGTFVFFRGDMTMSPTIAAVLAAATAISAGATQPAASGPLTVDLTCPGSGDGRQMVKNYLKTDRDDPNYVSRRVRVEGMVRVRVRGDTAEVQLPPDYTVLGDWLKVKKLVITDTEIRGSVQVGLLSSAKLSIDRVGGALTLRGDNGSFMGRCAAADPSKRAF